MKNLITIIFAALSTAASAQQLQVVRAGEVIDFEGNKGSMPSYVQGTEDIDGLEKVTFSDGRMTFHRAGGTTDYDINKVEKVSVAGNIHKMPIFYPPSVSRQLNFETDSDINLDINYTEGRATDKFTAAAEETVDVAATTALNPTAATKYTLQGTNTNGCLTITSDNDVMLLLDGVDLRNNGTPSIVFNGAGRLYVATKASTRNTITGIAMKGTGKVDISGEGLLRILSSGEHTAAIRATDNISVNGGTLNIFASGYCGQGIYSDKNVTINKGAVNIITTGDGTQADDDLGFDCAAAICAGVKGEKADGCVYAYGGKIRIKTIGGIGAIGVGAMHKIVLKDATVVIAAFDDALNAVDEIQLSNCKFFSTSAVDDGVDCNGALIFRGGNMYVCGPYPKEGAFDNDGKNFALESNPTLIAIGAKTDTPWGWKSTSASLNTKNLPAKKYLVIKDKAGKEIVAFITPEYPGNCAIAVAAPGIEATTEYDIYTADRCTSGTEDNGIITNGKFENLTLIASATSTDKK